MLQKAGKYSLTQNFYFIFLKCRLLNLLTMEFLIFCLLIE